MPTKHNKLRYQSKPKDRPLLTLSGNVYLQYRDDDKIEDPAKGDVMVYPSLEALHTIHQGDYDNAGYTGYFKADVHDGKDWKPLLAQGLFDSDEHHFSKRDHPIDVYTQCSATIARHAGRNLERTYREHYRILPEDIKSEE